MATVREAATSWRKIVPDDLWPLPKYAEMLFIASYDQNSSL